MRGHDLCFDKTCQGNRLAKHAEVEKQKRFEQRLGRSVMSRCGIRQQIRFVLILFSLWQYVETYFAEPDTTLGVYKLL